MILFLPMPLPAELRHSTREEVMFFDTDIGGVVHNLAYLRMIETCRTKLAGLMGMDLKGMAETKLYPVVVRTEIDYKRPAKLGDGLRVEGRVLEWSGVRFWVEFEVNRPSDAAQLVKCRQALALVQMPAGKPIRLPDGFPASLAFGDLVRKGTASAS